MEPYIRVKFEGMAHDPSVEASAHRWVARLETASVPIQGAFIVIEPAGRRCTGVRLKLDLVEGPPVTVATSQAEIYVAVADAFRAARRQLLSRSAASSRPRFGMGFAS